MRTTLMIAAVMLALPAAAQDHGQHGQPAAPRRPMMRQQAEGQHGAMGMPMMLEIHAFGPQHLIERREALALTDQQVERLTQLQDESTRTHDAAREAGQQHMEQAQAAWASGDAAGVTNHARLGMQSMQAAHLAMLQAASQAREVLTAEQRARVAGWTDVMRMHQGQMMQRRGAMRERMQQRRPPRQPPDQR